jgi:hypothetical protein
LKRVLRIRVLQEERSRMELEAEIARLREIERDAAAAASEARESRERSFAELAKLELIAPAIGDAAVREAFEGEQIGDAKGPSEQGSWRDAESAWEGAVCRQQGHAAKRPEQQERVERSRAEFLAGRRERLEAETLVEQAESREAAEKARREQRVLDDWFQAWAGRLRGEKRW